ncbi:MAG: ParB N-terminal domain-containing protein [Chthoniobacterales bacterium]
MDGSVNRTREIHNEIVDSIDVPAGRRQVQQEAVDRLADSMSRIGLRTPISIQVDVDAETWTLVAGAHRLAAAKKLGWQWIECFHIDGDETDARMVEIAENLHRAELTALERSEQIEEWRRLCEKVRTVAAPSGGAQPKEKGQRAAARELGISEKAVRKAGKVASLSDEAKQAAREAGLDDNQSALLEAARAPKERQAAVVHDLAHARRNRVDADVRNRAAREVAEIIAEYVPGGAWDGIKANLYAAGAANIANELTNVTGQSVMGSEWS